MNVNAVDKAPLSFLTLRICCLLFFLLSLPSLAQQLTTVHMRASLNAPIARHAPATAPLVAFRPRVSEELETPSTEWISIHYARLLIALLILSSIMYARMLKDGSFSFGRAASTAAVILAATDYLTWRISVVNWHAPWVSVPLFVAELFGITQIIGWHYTTWPRRAQFVQPTGAFSALPINIMIPTVNEGTEILRKTVLGAKVAARALVTAYPGNEPRIILCNDGRVAGFQQWQTIEQLANELGVLCVTRETPGGAKAGNIEYVRQTLQITGDCLIAVFDADMIPEPNFLLNTVPPFRDPTVGWVQSGQYYSNVDEPVARWAEDQQRIFFSRICPGKETLNAAFLCGTNFVMRAAALDQIGGLPQGCITEDFAASILLHGSWRGIYLTQKLASGLGPGDLAGYFTQQRRWAIGTLDATLRYRHKLFTFGGDLNTGQKVQYILSGTHYLSGVATAIFVLAPIIYLLGGSAAIVGTNAAWFFIHFVPLWALSQLAFWVNGDRHLHWRGALLGFAAFPTLISAVVGVLFKNTTGFIVTPKKRRKLSTWRVLVPHVLMLCLCVVALSVSITRDYNKDLLIISEFWVGLSSLMFCGVLLLAYTDGRVAATRAQTLPGAPNASREDG